MFHTIDEAISDLKQGKVIIVVDDEDRENEGDFIALSENITPETINFMITHGRGLVCTPITQTLATELDLPLMTSNSSDPYDTAFTISIDHQQTTTGISAVERAYTIKALTDSATTKDDFKRPGHVFPLIAKDGGVLERQGHTEASVDLARLCNSFPSAVICEIIKEDGTMARVPDLEEIANTFNLKMISIADLIEYRKKHDISVKREVETVLPTKFGTFKAIAYSNSFDDKEHIALVKGEDVFAEPVLTRVHSECLTGDVFGSCRCDCGPQLEKALALIQEKGSGAVIYMRQEGRDIGLTNKLRAYHLQDQGLDTVEANLALGLPEDGREYYVSAEILRDLGITKVDLMTNNPDKIDALEVCGIQVEHRIQIEAEVHPENKHYLQTKQEKMGHILSLEGER